MSDEAKNFWDKIATLLAEGNEDLAILLVSDVIHDKSRMAYLSEPKSIPVLARMRPLISRCFNRENHDATMLRLSMLRAQLFPKRSEET